MTKQSIQTFIKEFKQTRYYDQIFTRKDPKNILGIYLVGSTCMDLDDESSDYDITVLTLDNEYINVSEELVLKYKGKKVH
jgi:predicted nucleotidyltransferase